MHVACIAGSQVGNPSASPPPPPPNPPVVDHCCVRCANREDAYHADASDMSCGQAAKDFCDAAGKDRGAVADVFEGTCPDAP